MLPLLPLLLPLLLLLLLLLCRSFPVPWLLLAFLVYWLIHTYFFPPKPKA
jgi:hypothetical protein